MPLPLILGVGAAIAGAIVASEQVELIFTSDNELEVKGKKRGYQKAASEYQAVYQKMEVECNEAKETIKAQQATYGKQTNGLIEKLDDLEKQKEILKEQQEQKVKAVSAKYDIPIATVYSAACSHGGAGVFYNDNMRLGLIGSIYEHKEKKLLEAMQKGYLEARSLYEEKMERLTQDFSQYKKEADANALEFIELIAEMMNALITTNMEIADLKLLL